MVAIYIICGLLGIVIICMSFAMHAKQKKVKATIDQDAAEALKIYKTLLEQGVITEKEFEAEKAQLLKLR